MKLERFLWEAVCFKGGLNRAGERDEKEDGAIRERYPMTAVGGEFGQNGLYLPKMVRQAQGRGPCVLGGPHELYTAQSRRTNRA